MKVYNLNPCGFEGSDSCFDCQDCSLAPGDLPAVQVVAVIDGTLTRQTITGDQAREMQEAHGLSRRWD